MAEFFRGWKRKVGLLKLVLACVAMAGWLRSYVVYEFFTVESRWRYSVGSVRGTITYSKSTIFGAYVPFYEQYRTVDDVDGLGWINIPYWSIVLPLSVISGMLLVSKRVGTDFDSISKLGSAVDRAK